MIPASAILAPVDFSEASRASLTCAARLARRWGASLHVLHALDPLLAAAAASRGIDLAGETREELTAFMRTAYPAGEWAPMHHVVVGQAVDVVCDAAREHRAGLVVLGVRGLSGVARAMMGSTTEAVIRLVDSSILAVPGTWVPPATDTGDTGWGPVVVGIDRLDAPAALVRAAAALAGSLETELCVAHIVPDAPVLQRWLPHAEAVAAARVEQGRRELAAALQSIQTGVPTRVHVASGRVPDALVALAAEHRTSRPVIVLGRWTGTGRGHAPGSVASRVIAESHAPVLVHVPDA